VLTAPDETLSPFGSRVVPTAQVEALVAAVADRNRKAARARLARIETLRSEGAKRTDGDTHD
jgi:DNA-binding MurR/RpiR family transcriptional regulator